MTNITGLALRNLTRQKRRNAILAIAIAFGFFVVTVIDGLVSGMVGNLENVLTEMVGGTVMAQGVEKIPAEKEGEKEQLVTIVRDKNYLKNIVENNHIDYKYFSQYSMAGGTAIFNGKKSMAQIYGRDFTEKSFTDSFKVVEGKLEDVTKYSDKIVISDSFAESLNLKIGDNFIYSTTTIYGQNEVADFTVCAIVKASSLINGMQLYADIETINKIIGIPEGGYTTFTIFLKNKNQQTSVANKIEALIRQDGVNVTSRIEAAKTNPSNIGNGIEKQLKGNENQWEGVKYAVETLNDEVPAIQQILSVVHSVTTVILIVILLIVMVGVSNTYRMVLMERIREIGTMRALGMDGKDTKKLFTMEAVILCLIGAIAGLIMSVIFMFILHLFPISNESISFFLNKGHFSFSLSFGTILLQYALLILLTIIAVSGSAKKAARMSPAQALRTLK